VVKRDDYLMDVIYIDLNRSRKPELMFVQGENEIR
jgi:hypothetical protein